MLNPNSDSDPAPVVFSETASPGPPYLALSLLSTVCMYWHGLVVLVIFHLHVLVNCACTAVFIKSPPWLGASRNQGQDCPFSDSPSKSRLGLCQPKELSLGNEAQAPLAADLCHLQMHCRLWRQWSWGQHLPGGGNNNGGQLTFVEHLLSARHYASSLFTVFNPYNKFTKEVLLLSNEETDVQRCGQGATHICLTPKGAHK